MMPSIVGVTLALAVGLFARVVGLDRDRAFYPTVMIVIAVLYNLFAVLGGSTEALGYELIGSVAFIGLAVVGFKRDLRWVVVALAGHGVFDFFHHHLIFDPGVPEWWPAFCGTYDVTAAGFLAWILWRDGSLTKAV